MCGSTVRAGCARGKRRAKALLSCVRTNDLLGQLVCRTAVSTRLWSLGGNGISVPSCFPHPIRAAEFPPTFPISHHLSPTPPSPHPHSPESHPRNPRRPRMSPSSPHSRAHSPADPSSGPQRACAPPASATRRRRRVPVWVCRLWAGARCAWAHLMVGRGRVVVV